MWENCLKVIRSNITDQTFQTWFEPIRPVSLVSDVLTIQVPNQFFFEWLEEHYVHLLRQAIDIAIGTNGGLKYTFLADQEESTPETIGYPYQQQKTGGNGQNNGSIVQQNGQNQTGQTAPVNLYNFGVQLNSRYNFDTFIEGDCNRFARATALAVAQRPGVSSFNPLMLYGSTGFGKTHLVQAIGNHIVSNNQNKQVLYVPSEKFTTHFIESLKNNDLQRFMNIYTKVDILIIDDVQFLANKDRTQEVFFHIFNHLHQSGKQIVMTSDCPPKELQGLEERLVSRFKWGLTADLKQPDLETRMAIIQQKTQGENIVLTDEVTEYIAHAIDSNVRELEGAINNLIAQAWLYQGNINLSLAKKVVQQTVQASDNKEISIDEIQKNVSDYFNVTIEEMKSKTRTKEIVLARQVAMYFAKELTGFTLKAIGYHFGGRDHTTVLHALECINDYILEKREMKVHIDNLRQLLKK
ncbi:MAG TPA: chromosomal replication initiator protein DnaA [Microscillaceae bacterium]|nr:chromosomal replication initiator protein DnaA [Microscillaceae bacterium]